MRLFKEHFEINCYFTNLHNTQLFTHEKIKMHKPPFKKRVILNHSRGKKSKEHYMLVRSATSIGCIDKRWEMTIAKAQALQRLYFP